MQLVHLSTGRKVSISTCFTSKFYINDLHLAIVQVVDFYLDDARSKERAELIDLVRRDDAQSIELLHGYIREAQSELSLLESEHPFTNIYKNFRTSTTVPGAVASSGDE